MGNPSSSRSYKGRYFLDKIDKDVYSTNDFTLWNFYRSIFYGKPFPGELQGIIKGDSKPIDWSIVTHNGKIIHRFKEVIK